MIVGRQALFIPGLSMSKVPGQMEIPTATPDHAPPAPSPPALKIFETLSIA